MIRIRTKIKYYYCLSFLKNRRWANYRKRQLLLVSTLLTLSFLFCVLTANNVYLNPVDLLSGSSTLKSELRKFRAIHKDATDKILRMENDVVFSRSLFVSDSYSLANHQSVEQKLRRPFFMPKVLVANHHACSDHSNVFMLFLIHSHANNYLRRKAMRDSWLSLGHLDVLELFASDPVASAFVTEHLGFGRTLNLVHQFFVASDANHSESRNRQLLEAESRAHGDLVVIDMLETYKNLIYKHLTLVDWSVKYCSTAFFVVKLDDDVFVNVKSLAKHLVYKFAHKYETRGVESDDFKFLYCDIMAMAKPRRGDDSKWKISYEDYPFFFYPNYCGGFAYVTNIRTLRVINEQSQLVPRFWIDDAYVTGFLLHGLDHLGIQWYHFKYSLSWRFYNFWNMPDKQGPSIYSRLYNFIVSLVLDMNFNDLFLYEHFVVLHVHMEHSQFNYSSLASQTGNMLDMMSGNQRLEFKYASNDSLFNLCFSKANQTSALRNIKKNKNNKDIVESSPEKCFSFVNDPFSYYYYLFNYHLWSKISALVL